jgi:hypothetical protein
VQRGSLIINAGDFRMRTKNSMLTGLCAAMLATAGLSAQAASFDIDLAGWVAAGDFGDVGNSFQVLNVGAGQTVTGWTYTNLEFTTTGDSWMSELVVSVNEDDISDWLDWSPSSTNAGGTFGPADGAWGDAAGSPGPFGAGGPFVSQSGDLYIETYLSWFDPPPVGINIQSGTLHIQVVPEPGTYGLMALGLFAVGAAVRRRRG